MFKRILTLTLVGTLTGMLSACISGVKPPDTYTGQDGKTTIIESDREMCARSCNDTYSRCMDSHAATDNGGINGPSGVYGASAECRTDLQNCLPGCKAQ